MKASFVFVAALAASLSQADITSTFDVDNEGWQAANIDKTTFALVEPTQQTVWNAGHIEARESMFTRSGAFILLAPTKYTGDLSAYLGGSVSYLLSDATHDADIFQENLLLYGLDTATGKPLAIGYKTDAPVASGTAYTIPLNATGWNRSDSQPLTDAQFASVLSHVIGLGVGADWTSNASDSVALDNVRVAAVPEPSTLAALGLGLCAALRRRRLRVS